MFAVLVVANGEVYNSTNRFRTLSSSSVIQWANIMVSGSVVDNHCFTGSYLLKLVASREAN